MTFERPLSDLKAVAQATNPIARSWPNLAIALKSIRMTGLGKGDVTLFLGLEIEVMIGASYNPLSASWRLSRDLGVNDMAFAVNS